MSTNAQRIDANIAIDGQNISAEFYAKARAAKKYAAYWQDIAEIRAKAARRLLGIETADEQHSYVYEHSEYNKNCRANEARRLQAQVQAYAGTGSQFNYHRSKGKTMKINDTYVTYRLDNSGAMTYIDKAYFSEKYHDTQGRRHFNDYRFARRTESEAMREFLINLFDSAHCHVNIDAYMEVKNFDVYIDGYTYCMRREKNSTPKHIKKMIYGSEDYVLVDDDDIVESYEFIADPNMNPNQLTGLNWVVYHHLRNTQAYGQEYDLLRGLYRACPALMPAVDKDGRITADAWARAVGDGTGCRIHDFGGAFVNILR